jgi:hypothetical protein
MTYLCIDPRRYSMHKIFMHKGCCNPALAQNIAVRSACGEYIILTSPEILHAKQNLNNLDKIENLEKKFIFGRVVEKSETEVFSLHFPFEVLHTIDSAITLCDWKTTLESYALYFIGVMKRKTFFKYGGIDEKYMSGIAYDDEDFGYRMKAVGDELVLEFHNEVCGVHLTHDRSYQDPGAVAGNGDYFKSKKDSGLKNHLVANKEITMGDTIVLIEKAQFWRY